MHYGVTTQDILDTGLMLQVKEAWGHALGLLHSIRGHLLALALRHQHTPMVDAPTGSRRCPRPSATRSPSGWMKSTVTWRASTKRANASWSAT
ncbi:hypothetical protein P4123_15920 [Pseudomonas aeruginosa]|nr:hypothetical protein [Pseudomonas aeruginosa]